MPSVLSKNCVTTGVIDFYCLLCAEHFLHEDKAFEHLSKDKHKEAWRATDCYEKFKDDFITKIRSLYYCKLCDQTFTTIFKVKLHISETEHLLMKQNEIKSLERQDQDIVLFGKVVLSSNAWNGITDNTCLLCDVEFEEPGHINEEEHILNLIKSKIVFKRSFAYRQIGDTLQLHQCLTCNQIITKDALVAHANTTEHENSFKTNQPLTEEHIAKDNSNGKSAQKKPEEKQQKPGEESNGEIHGNVNKQSTNNDPLEIAKKLCLLQHEDKFYCKPCHCFISSAILDLKKHISSNEHKAKTIDLNNRPEVLDKSSTVSMKDIIKEGGILLHTSGRTEQEKYVVFRHKYMMMFRSFLCIMIRDKEVSYCHLCRNKFHERAEIHIKSAEHRQHMDISQLVTAIEGEVIRQITNNRYHCGYCSAVEMNWDNMRHHITTDEHYQEKIKIKLAFEEYEQNKEMESEFKTIMSFYGYIWTIDL